MNTKSCIQGKSRTTELLLLFFILKNVEVRSLTLNKLLICYKKWWISVQHVQ